MVSKIVIEDGSGNEICTVSGLSLPFADLRNGVGLTDLSARYAFWVSLLDGDLTVEGSAGSDRELEVGSGGTAIVDAGDGNDTLSIWHGKTVTFNGGSGTADTVTFLASYGDPYATPVVRQLVVDLKSGTGVNPYGGTLKLSGVENVVGTAGADRITGSDQANVIGDPFDTGADIVKAGKGNDTIKLGWAATGGADIDGGAGRDTLQFLASDITTDSARIVLDLETPSLNTFVFAGGSYRNVEVIEAGSSGGGGDTDIFVFGGSDADETVTGTTVQSFVGPAFRPQVGRDALSGRGGDDILKGLGGHDTLSGGSGDDTLLGGADPDRLQGNAGEDTASYADAFGGVTVSLAKPSASAGFAEGDRLTSIENLTGSIFADTLTGDSGRNRLDGGLDDDRLAGGGGKDVLTGGEGNDRFVFDAPLSRSRNVDVIADWSGISGDNDRFALDTAVFKGLSGQSLAANAFTLIANGASTREVDRSDRILYDKAHGDLYFDRDGSGDRYDRVKFAQVDDRTALNPDDFLIG